MNDPRNEFSFSYPPELPITQKKDEIVGLIKKSQVLVITGETGSGKSTQIPKMCLEAGQGRSRLIGCTQPRRIAAISLADRVAQEMGTIGRRLVGFKVRFQDRTSKSTRIKYMTDGILLAEAQRDRLFRRYDTLIVDEAHERTLNIDFLLGLIKRILPKRPDLKVIVTSATIDPEKFSKAFDDAPIVEVSGRMHPVEVWYRPVDESHEKENDVTYIDQAVDAVELIRRVRRENGRGDILIFMPTESDIRETVQRLEEKRYPNTLVMPLFGRMATLDQRRIFHATREEKIIVSTNIAETSITIPRIRYVIDTGLARIAQYNARSRTQGLPVLPISRASADQRKGRCGRVMAGICVRLYSEEDYQSRPLFTPPEIQRSSLAEVILGMLFLRLGKVEEFPFLDPPAPSAIKDGYAVLRELRAIDENRRLTRIGRTMAKLPLDPRLSRMLLQAQKEGAVREMMILAAVLSIQDPRERPFEQEDIADRMHARFRDPSSDFVTLLKIWQSTWGREAALVEKKETAPVQVSGLSRSQIRKFCREHYLSYRRMREWRDIHEEIQGILQELGELKLSDAPASYDAIHRSIVAGYLSHVAMRKEKNIYLAAKNKQVMIFPGSGLFNKGAGWIVAAELVQTTRLFARTVARIEPQWLEELGGQLCKYSYSEPHWEKKRGQVVALEKVTLYGLPIVERRKVNYGRIHPGEAREIFIRSALVEEQIFGKFDFLEHNRKLIQRIQDLESKTRRRDLLVDDETLFRFYDLRIPQEIEIGAEKRAVKQGGRSKGDRWKRLRPVVDLVTFRQFLKSLEDDSLLRMTESDLLRAEPDFAALEQFPDVLPVGEVKLPVKYVFSPGSEEDGVTVTIPLHLLGSLGGDRFTWLVPGLLREKAMLLLKALPKSIRRRLVPMNETLEAFLHWLQFGEGNLYAALSRFLKQVKDVHVPVSMWDEESLPNHLRMRFEVTGPDGQILGASRDFKSLMSLSSRRHEDELWNRARKAYEKTGLLAWDFDDVPPRIELGKDALGLERYAYPGLVDEGDSVAVRLFENPLEAREASRDGVKLLYELHFAPLLKALKKDWQFERNRVSMVFFMGGVEEANRRLREYVLRELFELHDLRFEAGWPDKEQFLENIRKLQGRLGRCGRELVDEVDRVIVERHQTRATIDQFRQMAAGNQAVLDRLRIISEELDKLVPPDFLASLRRPHIVQLPRYLKALRIRSERAYSAPEKDRLKAEQLMPYLEYLQDMEKAFSIEPTGCETPVLDEFRWMLEEFKISLFAPEVKTRMRVSPKRLEEKYQEWQLWREKKGLS